MAIIWPRPSIASRHCAVPGGAPPGQALVVLDQQRMLITDVFLSEDGHAQERRLIAQVLQHVGEDQLWIEDRNFCTLGLMFGMARRGAAFVVRQHGQVQGELLGRPTRKGTTRSGPVYEQSMLVRDPNSGETMRVRRITMTLKVPTRDGDTELHVLSNVPVPRASAAQLARLYGKRWSIETAFLRLPRPCRARSIRWAIPRRPCLRFAWRCWRQRGVAHQSRPAQCPWPPEGQ